MNRFRKYAMLISTLLLCGMLFLFFKNLRPRFNEVEADYISSPIRAINLSQETDADGLLQILINNGYVADPKDAKYIADTLVARLKKGLEYPNLYYLQKRDYGKVPALVADSLGVLVDKVQASYDKIGVMDSLPSVESLSSKFDYSLDTARSGGNGEINVFVYKSKEKSRGKILDILLKPKKEKKACKDILVCLREYYSGMENPGGEVVGYAKTDSDGRVVFTHLDTTKGYSVLPIQKGYEYGSSKGIVQHKFKEYKYFDRFGKIDYVFSFEQLEHRIQMIDNFMLKQIKNDSSITIRTPQEFKAEVIKWFVFVLLAWWLLAIVMIRRKRNFDPILIAAAMFMTGLCVIVMYAIQNPLTEELRGTEMATGVLMGIGLILLFQFVDFIKLYQNRYKLDFDIPMSILRWLFLPFKQKVSWLASVLSGSATWYKKLGAMLLLVCCLPFVIFNIPYISKINKPILRMLDKLPKGFGWLLFAIFLTTLLFFFGKEIGGMKVNLSLFGLTFQPSEIAKYLILFFVAAFFTQYADAIIAYSQPNRTRAGNSIWRKFKTLWWVFCGLVLLMLIYLKLGDMGPGIVLGITFVLLYSLVKSKVNLDNLDENDKWRRIFSCDFAMLIYGVVSFAVFIFIGYKWNGAETALLFGGLWFFGWIVFGIFNHKQFFETAFIINLLVFMFVFGGDVMKQIPALSDTDIAERFEQRTRMCANTWGELDIEHNGKNAEPVSNTQVANGLWAIATGGMRGQGLGDGNPNLIPAFHTDMILSSIAEQIGWVGLLLIVFVFALLLRRIIVVGYQVGHPFAFYFCMGVAIVTAVQFFIIALGSSGMIPLTGITVPFLSYGRVSMILNLAAIGVVLSLSKNIKQEDLSAVQEQVRQHSVGDYNYPISIVTWTYITLAAFTLCVWQYYAFWKRGNTLIHPAYVYSSAGLPMIEYNPRIALLTKEMWAGNIYDRNGLLLATSDQSKLGDKTESYKLLKDAGIADTTLKNISQAHTKRYYPFAEHLFFMLGDMNTGLYFSYNEDNPIGYMAEVQYLSYLRDYDNLHDKKGRLMPKIELHGEISANSRYLNAKHDTIVSIRVRDNHELIKYLKYGIYGKPLKDHNEKIKKGDCDLKLTLDAKLQMDMQNSIEKHVKETTLKNNNLLRISVVVLDAENGDLLTSANYPLPDQIRLQKEEDDAKAQGKKYAVWSDNYKANGWKTYTDRDLGLTYQTQPGSTAKVMSAMAGLQKLDIAAADKKYLITYEDIIESGSAEEPYKGKSYSRKVPFVIDRVDMKTAIVESSNCYFINLVNDNNLYRNLDSIYEAVGIRIDSITPYYLSYGVDDKKHTQFKKCVQSVNNRAISKYRQYIDAGIHRKMNDGDWQWAWGQGTMSATPLNMARVASAVVNDGVMPTTQYVIPTNEETRKMRVEKGIQLLKKGVANILRRFMKEESENQYYRQGKEVNLPEYVGGKTGTPEREHIKEGGAKTIYSKKRDKYITLYYHEPTKNSSGGWKSNRPKKNDGWYMFFVEGRDGKHPLAVCVRMERGPGSGSAVRLTESVVLEVLKTNGYINE